MKNMTRLLMGIAAFYGVAANAEAADLSQPQVINYPSAAPAVPVASGWYLRGDIGVGIVQQQSLYESSIANPTAGTTSGWLNKTIGDTTTIGAGVGYQFSDNLRGDVTVQYRTSTPFQGGDYITNTATGATGENDISGNTSSTIALVNGYYDVTHWNGITPFVGAGIGAAFNQMRATSTQQGGFTNPEYGVYPSKSITSFAWALHTGLSYDINSRLKLELGYTYLNYGDSKAAPLTCYGATTSVACNDELRNKKLSSSDFHIGFRYMLDNVASTSVYQQSSWQQPTTYATPYPPSSAPVVAKY
jgi:opacity protein-like surface antigen